MSKFGKKFTCWKCSTKFYDLNKAGAKCPKCGADPADDPNQGMPLAAIPAGPDEFTDEVEEEIPEEVAEDEELDDEPSDDDPAGGDADEF